MFSMTACFAYFILGFIEAYYSTGAWANNCNDIGSDGIIHNHCRTIYEWVFASVMIFFILYLTFRHYHSITSILFLSSK